VRSTTGFASDAAVAAPQGLRSRSTGAVSGQRDHEEAAGAVLGWPPTPDPIGRSPHRSVHRFLQSPSQWLAISIASAKSGTLAVEATLGRDIDMVTGQAVTV